LAITATTPPTPSTTANAKPRPQRLLVYRSLHYNSLNSTRYLHIYTMASEKSDAIKQEGKASMHLSWHPLEHKLT
jgi:pyridoxine/pyridoxamine 5'-phosphate oxidase